MASSAAAVLHLLMNLFLTVIESLINRLHAIKISSCGSPCDVKLMWVNNTKESVVGLSAAFGAPLQTHADNALRYPAAFENPSIAAQVQPQIDRAFTMEAEVAESGGASGLLVIIDNEGLYKMACCENDTSINMTIPVVMISRSRQGRLLVKGNLLFKVSAAAETFKDDSAKEFALVWILGNARLPSYRDLKDIQEFWE
ncbi:hypothetical protein MKW98_028382 [Papaver atlanticum]|uniref:Uncharacterized protein n=1 Tax=Papaver atlanticum TaxID=357466 RepID=A0AAD4XNE9_9MAGN|nr:hypothetical protein MKW98_028382 [Papaver atlanticum]